MKGLNKKLLSLFSVVGGVKTFFKYWSHSYRNIVTREIKMQPCWLIEFIQLMYKSTKQFYSIKTESIRHISYFYCVKHTLILLYFVNLITKKYVFCKFQGEKGSILLSGMSGPIYCKYVYFSVCILTIHVQNGWLTKLRSSQCSILWLFCDFI